MSAVHKFQRRGEHAQLLPAKLVCSVLFAGPIPPALRNLSVLQELLLSGNKLSGESVGERVDIFHRCIVRMNVAVHSFRRGENMLS